MIKDIGPHFNNSADVVARINALAVSDLDDQASGLHSMLTSSVSANKATVEWANGSDLPTDSDSDAFENTP